LKSTGKYKAIIFDLDGTLTASDDTIIDTTIQTLKKMDLYKSFDMEILRGMIGHHFKEIFEKLEIVVPDMEAFISEFREIYFDFIDSSYIYPGVENILNKLKSTDIKTAVLTTKGNEQAEVIVKHFNLGKYFNIINGRIPGLPVKPAPEPLQKIISELGVTPGETLMVGDTEMDILCAKNAGTASCAVTFGYRSLEELQQLNPDYLVNNYKELEIILGL